MKRTFAPGLALWRTLSQPTVIMPLAAVVGASLVGLVIMAAMGVPLSDSIGAFLDGAFGTEYALAASINRAVIFSAIGLGFIFANQANLTNVGGEGQIAVAAIAAAAVALKTPVADLPGPLAYLLP